MRHSTYSQRHSTYSKEKRHDNGENKLNKLNKNGVRRPVRNGDYAHLMSQFLELLLNCLPVC